jgi:hypothetical protein
MEREMLKSKIHRARVTRTDLEYEGSVTIDRSLLEAAGIDFMLIGGRPFSSTAVLGSPRTSI